jgi:voltage-gated potassium channel
MNSRSKLVFSLLSVVLVYFVGAAGYVVLEGASFRDAAYMTTITLSTVGYQEAVELGEVGRLWTIAVITFGLITVSVATASLISLFVEGEVRDLLGRRRMKARLEHLKGHVVICGYGRMGEFTAKELRDNNLEIVVIDNTAQKIREAEAEGLLAVFGDATEEGTLQQAATDRAEYLVAVLSNDADNVFVSLTARDLNPSLTIIARAEQPSTRPKLERAGANKVISPQTIGATKAANLILRPIVTDFVEVAAKGVELELDEFIVTQGSGLAGVALKDSELRGRFGVSVVAIKRADGTTVYNPEPSESLRISDTLIMIGKAGASTKLMQLRQPV